MPTTQYCVVERKGNSFMDYFNPNVKREKLKDYYRLTYRTGFYSLDQLIQRYQDYESHREDWAKTPQYGNFLVGLLALLQVINEIKAGILHKDLLRLSADKVVE